jgi:hypothetical protein
MLARVVEAGIRLVEHHEAGIAEKGSRKAQALAVTTRKTAFGIRNDRIVRLREPRNHFVEPNPLCSLDDLLRIGVIQARNDLLYRFPDEVDVLRQIPEMLPAL